MVAQVVPGVRLPRGMGPFDYLIPPHLAGRLKVGQAVRVPFRHRTISGVVWTLLVNPTIELGRLRSVESIDESIPSLTAVQRSLIDWLSLRYAVPQSLFVKAHIENQRAKRGSQYHKPLDRRLPPLDLPTFLKTVETAGVTVGVYNRQHERDALLGTILASRLTQPIVIIVPELPRLRSLAPQLPTSAAILYGEQRPPDHWQNLRRLPNATHIVGTRSVLVTPLPRPGLIVVDDEDNEQHKQRDQQPRFLSLRVAYELARQAGCPVLALSASPSLAAYGVVRSSPQRLIQIGGAESARVRLIERRYQSRRRGLLTPDFRLAIETFLRAGERMFIFLNRRGLSRMVTCADCGWVARCPTCETAMVRYEHTLRCPTCGQHVPAPSVCATCASSRLEFVFPGTAGLERELLAHFPEAITRLDSDTRMRTAATPIVLGTEYALPHLTAVQPDHVLALGTDAFFAQPSARALERGFQILRRLATIDSVKTLTIETRYPRHQLFQALAKGEVGAFLESEWVARERHHLPPACPTVAFETRLRNASEHELRTWLRQANVELRFLRGPVTVRNGRKPATRYLLEGTAEAIVTRQLTPLPKSWIIDPDPLE